MFPQIQEAYDNLSDPAKRREFDSVDEFDDTLPEACAAADFYKVSLTRWHCATSWGGQSGQLLFSTCGAAQAASTVCCVSSSCAAAGA